MAVFMAFSAVDDSRYETAYHIHGFRPAVALMRANGAGTWVVESVCPPRKGKETSWRENALNKFITRNRKYAERVSDILCSFGNIPRKPGNGQVVLTVGPS
jgi:hypothetical protein